MNKPSGKRGRPRKADALTAAERMRAYRKRRRDAGFKDVRRWELKQGEGARRYSDQRILDARSLAMHCMIARKISENPRLLEKAKNNLARWRTKTTGPQPQYLKEWAEILERPWPEIANLITEMSDEATRLRSSSPFAGVLSQQERNRIYAAFRP